MILIGEPLVPSNMTQEYFEAYDPGLLPYLLSCNQQILYLSTKKPLYALGSSIAYTAVNVPLTYILTNVANKGYTGLGWASTAAYGTTAILFFLPQLLNKEQRSYGLLKCASDSIPSLKEFKDFIIKGGQFSLQIGLELAANMFIALLIGRVGTPQLVASQIGFQYQYLMLIPLANAANSVSYGVSQNSKSIRNVARIRNISLILGFTIPAFFLLATLIEPDLFLSPFLDVNEDSNSAKETIKISKEYLWLLNATLCVNIPRLIEGAYIRGLSKETHQAFRASIASNTIAVGGGLLLSLIASIGTTGFFYAKLAGEFLVFPWLSWQSVKLNRSRSPQPSSSTNEEKRSWKECLLSPFSFFRAKKEINKHDIFVANNRQYYSDPVESPHSSPRHFARG